MKISARNVLKGKVKNVKHGAVNAEVTIELSGGIEVVSIITEASVSNLGLNTGKDVYAVVKASKFAPRGHRGYSGFSFAGHWGADSGRDWIEWCDQELLVGVMIENEQVVNQVEKVMAIEGLDYCMFGPADYSMSIGLRSSQKDNPKVQDAIKRTAEAAGKYNKQVAIGVGEPYEAEAKKYIDMGLRIIEVGHELGILRSVYQKAGEEIRALRF